MKKIYALFAFGAMTFAVNAQTVVSTTPSNRVAILEEFTGTSCPACPGGHTAATNMLNAYPSQAFAIGLSPTNSSLTGPYNGGMNLTNSFGNAMYTNPYYGNGAGRSMPSGHMNRIKYGGVRKLSTGAWSTKASEVIAMPSPVNVGVISNYNSSTDMVDVTVELYFTSTVTDAAYVTVILTESEIITTQSGAGTAPDYNHKHVMRAALQSGQWGDAVTGATTAGSFVSMSFSYDNSTTNYVIDNSEIIAFVSTGTGDNSEIISGFGVEANGGSGTTASVESLEANGELAVYPNPTTDEINIALPANMQNGTISIASLSGAIVYSNEVNEGGSLLMLTASELNLEAGTYIVSVSSENGLKRAKLIIK